MRPGVIRSVIWAVALLKLLLAALTIGTNDVSFFRHFGWELLQHGLGYEYREDPLFNHTPLVGAYSVLLTLVSCGSERLFAFLLRLPGIIADAAVAFALLRRTEWFEDRPLWLCLLFTLSPTALMVSGFHGNVDAVLAACLFFATMGADRNQPFSSGLWVGLACNVKVAALLATPVFFFYWFARKGARQFLVPAAVVIVLGWLPALLLAPHDFARQVLGYSGYWGIWGITLLLKETGLTAFQVIGSEQLPRAEMLVMQVLKFAVLGGALILAWVRRKENLWLTLALLWSVFMVAASGVAAQYLIWPMALIFVAVPRGWAAAEVGNAVFLFVFYTVLCGGLPWYYGEANAIVNEGWLRWSVVAWIGWMCCLLLVTRAARTRPPCLSASGG